jgi:hypothetical protein
VTTIATGAVFSEDGRYRYRLWRELPLSLLAGPNADRAMLFVMLNPSTADERVDDPTIRRCMGFALSMGYGRLEVVNLFGWRATDPYELLTVVDPVGPDNDTAIAAAADAAGLIVAAWGVAQRWQARVDRVLALLREMGPLHVLELTKDGYPRHPLYVPHDCLPRLWPEVSRADPV